MGRESEALAQRELQSFDEEEIQEEMAQSEIVEHKPPLVISKGTFTTEKIHSTKIQPTPKKLPGKTSKSKFTEKSDNVTSKEEKFARLQRARQLGNIYMRQSMEKEQQPSVARNKRPAAASQKKKSDPRTAREAERKGNKRRGSRKDSKTDEEEEEDEGTRLRRQYFEVSRQDQLDREVEWTEEREAVWKEVYAKALAEAEKAEERREEKLVQWYKARDNWIKRMDQMDRGVILDEQREAVWKETYAKVQSEVEQFERMREQEIAEKRLREESYRPKRRLWGESRETRGALITKEELKQAIDEARRKIAEKAALRTDLNYQDEEVTDTVTPVPKMQRRVSFSDVDEEIEPHGERDTQEADESECIEKPQELPRRKWFLPQNEQQQADLKFAILDGAGVEYDGDDEEHVEEVEEDEGKVIWNIPEEQGREMWKKARLERELFLPPGQKNKQEVPAPQNVSGVETSVHKEQEEEKEEEEEEEGGVVWQIPEERGRELWREARLRREPLLPPGHIEEEEQFTSQEDTQVDGAVEDKMATEKRRWPQPQSLIRTQTFRENKAQEDEKDEEEEEEDEEGGVEVHVPLGNQGSRWAFKQAQSDSQPFLPPGDDT